MSYQFLPPLSDAEYEALRADIAANGMRHPIIVDEKGKILDGHHRARIAAELGFKPEREVVAGLTEQDKRDLAFTMNTARRHMDAAQRRAAVIESLKADPQLSDRQHGRRTGVSHPTVAGIRAELETAGRLESFTSRLGADGRERPATQTPARRDPEPTIPGPAIATTGGPDTNAPSGPDSPRDRAGSDHPSAKGEADARLDDDGSRGGTPSSSEVPGEGRNSPEAGETSPAGSPGVAEPAGDTPNRPRPPAWAPEERRQHEEDVRRRQDIEAARRSAKTIVTTVRSEVVTIVTGCRYGERGLVTKQLVTDLRTALDLLEEEVDGEE